MIVVSRSEVCWEHYVLAVKHPVKVRSALPCGCRICATLRDMGLIQERRFMLFVVILNASPCMVRCGFGLLWYVFVAGWVNCIVKIMSEKSFWRVG